VEPASRVNPILVNYPQRSEEWRQARRGNVTGSDAKKCFYEIGPMAKNAAIRQLLNVKQLNAKVKATTQYLDLVHKDPFELFDLAGITPPEPAARIQYRRLKIAERLTGMDADPDGGFVTHDMKWGIVSESLAKSVYQLETGNIVTEAPFMLHPKIRAGASPDGFVTEADTGLLGVIECKCLRSHNQLYDIIRTGEIPEEFMVQIHMEIWISGRDFCDFIAYDSRLPKGLEIFVKRVERDDEYINQILEPEIVRFLDDCQKDDNYFRMKIREEIERRKKEGLIIMPRNNIEIRDLVLS
jgi:hypothetical protein